MDQNATKVKTDKYKNLGTTQNQESGIYNVLNGYHVTLNAINILILSSALLGLIYVQFRKK